MSKEPILSSNCKYCNTFLKSEDEYVERVCSDCKQKIVDGMIESTMRIESNKKEAVTHPSHYAEGRKHEPIDVITDWELDFCLGNVVKYISRAGRKKDELEDLKKARFYLDYKIKSMEE